MDENNFRYGPAVRDAQRGSQEAFNFLYQKTYRQKLYLAKRYMKSDSDAEDVLQESYVKAWRHLSDLQDPENFSSWLGMIVANTAKTALKKKQPMLFSDLEEPNEEGDDFILDIPDDRTDIQPENAFIDRDRARILKELTESLSEEQNMAITMFYMENQSITAIAAAMGCSENTVKSRLNYGRKNLKKKVEELQKRGLVLGFAGIPLLLYLTAEDASAQAIRLPYMSAYRIGGKAAGAAATGAGAARTGAGSTMPGAGAAGSGSFLSGTAAKILAVILIAGLGAGIGITVYHFASNLPATETESPAAETLLTPEQNPISSEPAVNAQAETTPAVTGTVSISDIPVATQLPGTNQEPLQTISPVVTVAPTSEPVADQAAEPAAVPTSEPAAVQNSEPAADQAAEPAADQAAAQASAVGSAPVTVDLLTALQSGDFSMFEGTYACPSQYNGYFGSMYPDMAALTLNADGTTSGGALNGRAFWSGNTPASVIKLPDGGYRCDISYTDDYHRESFYIYPKGVAPSDIFDGGYSLWHGIPIDQNLTDNVVIYYMISDHVDSGLTYVVYVGSPDLGSSVNPDGTVTINGSSPDQSVNADPNASGETPASGAAAASTGLPAEMQNVRLAHFYDPRSSDGILFDEVNSFLFMQNAITIAGNGSEINYRITFDQVTKSSEHGYQLHITGVTLLQADEFSRRNNTQSPVSITEDQYPFHTGETITIVTSGASEEEVPNRVPYLTSYQREDPGFRSDYYYVNGVAYQVKSASPVTSGQF